MDRKIQVVTSGFIQKGDQFLIVKRAVDETFLPNVWELPGGKSEVDENPNASVIREIKEECGIDVKIKKPVLIKSYISEEKNTQYIEIFYITMPIDFSQDIKLSLEHSDSVWINETDLEKYTSEMTPYILETIKYILGNQ